MFDLIGDIHGHFTELLRLLDELGYQQQGSAFRHPDRKAIFLGDFIDRGSGSMAVIETVRAMVEAGSALAVMGNHEFNALAYHTPHPEQPGEYLRPRTAKNTTQHQATLDALEGQPPDTMLDWFYGLPLWLDLGDIRVVHACWDEPSMQVLKKAGAVDEQNRLRPASLQAASTWGDPVFKAVEIILKGMEVTLPGGITYQDKEGNERSEIRITWWDAAQKSSWRELAMGPRHLRDALPVDKGPEPRISKSYPGSAPPVFLGHYWLSGEPKPLAPNVACVDYSVAKQGGALAAYRWQGERVLKKEHFLTVPRRSSPSPRWRALRGQSLAVAGCSWPGSVS